MAISDTIKPHAEMTHHFSYSQGLDARDGVIESGSITPNPLSGTISSFRASATNGFHDGSSDGNGRGYDDGVDDRTHNAAPEASNPGSVKPCEYGHTRAYNC